MLQSSPAYIKCHQCKRGPKEFSFLLCNHIICSKCISKNIQLKDKYNLVRCSCGSVTYFNQYNQMVENYQNNNNNDNYGVNVNHRFQQQQQNLYINAKNKKKRNTTNNDIIVNSNNNDNNNNYNNNTRIYNNKSSTLISTPHNQISDIFSLLQSQNNHTINNSNTNTDSSNEQLSQQYKQCYRQDNNDDQTTTGIMMMGNQDDNKSFCDQSLLLENYCSIIKSRQKQCKNKNSNNNRNNKNKNNTKNLINQFSTHYIIDNKSSNNICDDDEKYYVNTNNNANKQTKSIKHQEETKHKKQSQRQLNQYQSKKQSQKQLNQYQSNKQIYVNQSLLTNNKTNQIINIPNVKNITSSVTLPQTIQSLKSTINQHQQQQQQQPSSLKHDTNPNTNQQHTRFHNQLTFIKLMFNKDLQQLKYIVDNLVNEIKSKYQKFQNTIRSLYVERVIVAQNSNKKASQQLQLQINLSQLIKQKYQRDISQKFTLIKDSLSTIFCSFKHNQNKLISTPTLSSHHRHELNIHQYLNGKNNDKNTNKYYFRSKQNYYQTAQTLNNSQIIQDYQQQDGLLNYYDCDQQSQTMKNHHIKKFQTVNEKMQRLTTKNNENRNLKSPKNHLNSFNSSSNKRVQTQNVHTNVKRSRVNVNFYQKENQDRANCSIQHLTPTPEINYRLTQKPQRKTNPSSLEKQTENKRRQIIYFSPPLPYCQKHLQKKQKQAKNYISYIEKLCHDKKMKNHQQLFKKVKQNNQLYEFRNRGGE